jgi:hypothetical protein
MIAGLPGTGLGGLFYLVLVLLMPARELWLTLRGRGDAARWRTVGVQAGLAAAIVGVLWAEGWALARLAALVAGPAAGGVADPASAGGSAAAAGGAVALGHMAPAVALLPLVVLALLWLGTHALRLALGDARDAAPPLPPPVPVASEAERRRVRRRSSASRRVRVYPAPGRATAAAAGAG